MDRIARAVEPSLGYRHEIPGGERGADGRPARCRTRPATSPRRCGAKAIVVPTFTGRTASAVARLRPRRPIIALTHNDWALRQMALEWGVTPLLDPGGDRRRGSLDDVDRAAREAGHRRAGDRVVITAGTRSTSRARRT